MLTWDSRRSRDGMVVSNSSPLIALAKTGRLRLLRDVYGRVAIGPKVYVEVIDAGERVGAPEVRLVEAGLEEAWIWRVRPTPAESRLTARILKGARLHAGEAEAIALARSRNGMVLLDDKEARAVAGAIGVDFVGTAGVLVEASLREVLDYQGLAEALRDLSRILWLSPEVIAEILNRAREVRR